MTWRSIARFFGFPVRPDAPPITYEMEQRDLTWRLEPDGEWIMACRVCGGNCGQCGMTSYLGNIGFSMGRIADNLEGRNRPFKLSSPKYDRGRRK